MTERGPQACAPARARWWLRPRTVVIAVACAVLLPVALMWAAFLFLISQEDYQPAPGTLTYYLGISSLVRGVVVPGAAGAPHYYGTVGDGNKPARSEVAYEVPPEHLEETVAAVHAYLLRNGLHERAVDAEGRAMVQAYYGELVRYTEYEAPQGGLVVLIVEPLRGGPTHRLSVSDYD
ncbi:hypothetical protein [Acidovorax sp.]|uniref:hypothetical protein n=1 Tax=Acidovorax sp. TaxID=1872122 RepID=UPI00391D1559